MKNHPLKKKRKAFLSFSLSLSLSKNERTQEKRVRVLDLRGGVLKSCPGDSRPSSPRGHPPGHQILPVFHPSPRLARSHPSRFVTLATSRWRTRVSPPWKARRATFREVARGKAPRSTPPTVGLLSSNFLPLSPSTSSSSSSSSS